MRHNDTYPPSEHHHADAATDHTYLAAYDNDYHANAAADHDFVDHCV